MCAATYPHPVGTCAMGTDPGDGAVVDPDGRVHGVVGLSVVDASVLPELPSANTNVPTIMLAEHLAARRAAAQAGRPPRLAPPPPLTGAPDRGGEGRAGEPVGHLAHPAR